ncbi:MAG: T9SS type B sorting domain-containing protein [Firmicutes bacterium]|nr:T9SS type B sorting domain-containing protein [Bacillota bacterium]
MAELGGTTTSWWEQAAYTYTQGWAALAPGEWDDTHWLAGLSTGTIYYIAMRAKDDVGNEALNNNVASAMPKVEDETSPAAIIDLVAEPGAGYDRIDLSWTAPGDDGWGGMATKYIIKYATYNITADNFNSVTDVKERNVTVSGGNPDSETITGLASDTLYYFAIKTEDEVPNVSGISNIATAIIREDILESRQPAGIKGVLSADGKTMTINWNGVSKNEDGTACEDLVGYNIYRASAVDGEYILVDFVAKGESLVWTDPEDIKGRTFYYMVRAKDTAGNLSNISMIADSSKDMNIIAVNSEQMSTRMVIPKEIKQILYKENNSYGDDVIIEVLRNREEESGRVIKSYSFLATKGQSGKEIKNFVFARPLARVALTYEVENGHVKRASSVLADRASEQLALFWFNGLEWIKLGGEVDESFHLVSIRSKRIGKYMIKESLRASSFVITGTQPDKIFTPNGDGWNDYFEIQYDNPNKDGSVSGKIYDLRGALVAGMKKGANDETLMWDGKDANGNPAPGGVYIYQIEVTGSENKVINGTVVVAR